MAIIIYKSGAAVSELVDERDSKSRDGNIMRVRFSPAAQNMLLRKKRELAYVIGLAIGDGNLSNSNNRAVRLRITCDNKYPKLLNRICKILQKIMPLNKVSIVVRNQGCCDVSCYSNQWEELLGWKAKGGPKHLQKVRIPKWIMDSEKFSIQCLRGLIETDGSIYFDRKYKMVNFVTIIPELVNDVIMIIKRLGFDANLYIIKTKSADKYTIRLSKRTDEFIKILKLLKN